jgi:hypothetical protein
MGGPGAESRAGDSDVAGVQAPVCMVAGLQTDSLACLPGCAMLCCAVMQRVAQQLKDAFDIEPADCLKVSAKTGACWDGACAAHSEKNTC